LSGTLNSAFQAKDIVSSKTNIELVDSLTTTTGLALVVIHAAKVARNGGDLQQVLSAAREAIDNNSSLCLLDTLKYLEKGGRIGKAKALLGSILSVKPIISIKDGEVIPFTQARNRAKGLDTLYEFVSKFKEIEDMAVAYTTTKEDAENLAQRVQPLFKKGKVKIFRMGITLGVHTGPGSLVLSVFGK
jgi:DegV family protein with EDD domain